MNHLSSSELVDLVEGTLDGPRAAHAERCEACRQAGAELSQALQLAVQRTDVPEPSPLFWDHFSARVRDAVAQEPLPVGGWFAWRPAIVAFGALAVVAIAVGALFMRPAPVIIGPESAVTRVAEAPAALDATFDTNSEVWEVLTAAAADMEWDDARDAGLGVQPAAVDHAVQRLSADELHELGRLLKSELGMSGD